MCKAQHSAWHISNPGMQMKPFHNFPSWESPLEDPGVTQGWSLPPSPGVGGGGVALVAGAVPAQRGRAYSYPGRVQSHSPLGPVALHTGRLTSGESSPRRDSVLNPGSCPSPAAQRGLLAVMATITLHCPLAPHTHQ